MTSALGTMSTPSPGFRRLRWTAAVCGLAIAISGCTSKVSGSASSSQGTRSASVVVESPSGAASVGAESNGPTPGSTARTSSQEPAAPSSLGNLPAASSRERTPALPSSSKGPATSVPQTRATIDQSDSTNQLAGNVVCPSNASISRLIQAPVEIRPDTEPYVDCEYVTVGSSTLALALTASNNPQSYKALAPYLTKPFVAASPEGSILAIFDHGDRWSLAATATEVINDGTTSSLGIGEGLAASDTYICGAAIAVGDPKVLEAATRAATQIVRDWCADDTRLRKTNQN